MSTLSHMSETLSPDLGARVTPSVWPPEPARWLNRLAQRSDALHARLQVPLRTSWEGDPMPQPRWVAVNDPLAQEMGLPAQ